MSTTAKQQFAERLVEALRTRGHHSRRGATSGVDVGPLAMAASVSREMARRYTDGTAMPDPNRMRKIADWLGVRVVWLRDGDGEPQAAELSAREAAARYLSPEAEEVARVWMTLPAPQREWFRAYLNQQAVIAKKYPWLMFGRPTSEGYEQFERRAELNYAAALRLEATRSKS